ncbi:ABC transporter permease [Bradyrhizobium sp. HKCCYLS2038]|uniref:ABC transporter permease n=1 Tax=unclassified Bradyrhizobium TaxID=2631580 RepID=UPI003EBEC83D
MILLMSRREWVLAGIIVVMTLLIGLRAPVFLSPGNLLFILTDTSVLFMMALAQMTVILTRGIDLSVAANLALTGMIVALLSRTMPGLPIPVVMLAAMLLGAGLGLVNGLLIAGLEMPPIVVTLGTLSIYRGLIFVLAGGAWLTSKDMTEAFLAFPKASMLGIPSLIWVAAAVAVAFAIFLGRSRTGRGLYAVGGNPVAARHCGVNLKRLQLLVYTLTGTVSGLAGYLWVARFGIAYADIAAGYELTVIAACVIGGVSIAGGIGSVPGTLLGALFLGIVANALPLINISPFWQMAISGAVILAAVIVNTRSEWKPQKLILREARQAAGGRR